jgi:hypothetical protein
VADLTVPDVFQPDDHVALFCVSMAMAANDVEYAIRQAILANPDGASDEDRTRLRFNYKVRLTYGFLFEGIDALKGWRQQEPDVAKLLRELPEDGAKLLSRSVVWSSGSARRRSATSAITPSTIRTQSRPRPPAGWTNSPRSSASLTTCPQPSQ